MRPTNFRGLAVLASLLMLGTATAQQSPYGTQPTPYGTWNQNQTRGYNASGRTGIPLNRYQDTPVPFDAPAEPSPSFATPSAPQPAYQPNYGIGSAPQVPGPALSVGSGCGNCGTSDCGTIGGCGTGGCDLGGCGTGRSANWVAGVNGLIFDRDYEDDKSLSYSSLYPTTQRLFSTDADLDTLGGFEAFISRRNCNNRGWELRYWALFPSEADVSLGNSPYTILNGFTCIDHPPSGYTAYDIFNAADSHRIYRNTDISNLEFNLLQNAGANCGRSWEWLAGVRWFQFNEDFRYAAFSTNPAYPQLLAYDLATSNDLIGFQLGGRSEICLNRKWSLNVGLKGGIYGNRITARQAFHDENNLHGRINAGPYANQDYEFESTKNDVAFLGELDLGLIYLMSPCWRARVGYRAVGVSGVALAVDQIPYSFHDVQDINRIKSNGSLLLHGLYFGLEHSF